MREVAVGAASSTSDALQIDFGGALNPNFAARVNAVYENSDSYRDFVHLERYGFNPPLTFRPTDATTFALSYEYFHDRRTTDRGIPRRARRHHECRIPAATLPHVPSTFFGNPNLNYALVDAKSPRP